ncbi:MAG TPA: MFS transporter, partial [Candidatus Dormibacteraeota bacterium]|nr:MFS transporter [Candidatus Dormibacteraeota bacterium]
ALRASGGTAALTAGGALDPTRLAQLPPAVHEGIRAGMADALHQVYLAGIPFLALALLATLLLREVPLRRSSRPAPEARRDAA